MFEDNGGYFKYRLSTLYWPGSSGKSQKESGIPEETYIPKEDVTFVSNKQGDYS